MSTLKHGIEPARHAIGAAEQEAAELGAEGTRAEVELLHVGTLSLRGLGAGRPLLIKPARQACESFVAQDLVDRDRADGDAVVLQGPADVVDGEMLFAQRDDALAELVALRLLFDGIGRGAKEVPIGVLSELMNEPTKATGRLAEAFGRFFGGKALDEVSAEGFVLALAGGFGLKEAWGEC